jgi:hypothetical protein
MISRYTYIHSIDVLPPLHIPECEVNIFNIFSNQAKLNHETKLMYIIMDVK